MPFSFVLPTTSSFSFSSSFTCDTHPSLLPNASTYRGVARDTLKNHKRLPPAQQAANLASVTSSLDRYLPYVFAVDSGLKTRPLHGQPITVTVKGSGPVIEWRPTLSDSLVPGKESARVRIRSFDDEVAFTLTTLANTYSLQARVALRPLHDTSTAPVGTQERQAAISAATRLLLDAAALQDYAATRAEHSSSSAPPPSADIAAPVLRAQAALALAEATLLFVRKDDPYPAAAAQDRNPHDREWMFKAPDMPRVRAHLFARVCLEAAEHAARALALCRGAPPTSAGRAGGVGEAFVGYLEDLRRTARARACRFLGIDAELGGETGKAIAWLNAALLELGVEGARKRAAGAGGASGLGFRKLKKDWAERREDRRVEKGTDWGGDAGRMEEIRVIEMLEAKWTKENDTMNTQPIPDTGPLLAQLPTGRPVYTLNPYQPPVLDEATLESMRAPPAPADDVGAAADSDDEATLAEASPVGAFPGTGGEYRSSSTSYY